MEERLRNLVTIRKVAEILPIEGADAIELAIVDGWQCVVKKSEFVPGSYCLFMEVDSFLPIRPEYEFLRKSCYKKLSDGTEGFRLKTVRLRGTLSQGLALPISGSILSTLLKIAGPCSSFDDFMGHDLSEVYGVIKYEPPEGAVLSGDAKGLFPSHTKKSDQERCLAFDTIINTPDGDLTIQEIVENDLDVLVLSFNEEKDEKEFKPIIGRSSIRNNKDWYRIYLEDGTYLDATSNHRIYLPELKCYRLVSELIIGDVLYKDRLPTSVLEVSDVQLSNMQSKKPQESL